ncbi:DMT family transporter [Bartonella sp. DGB2]|uniref:DMT family transporter n=1 Tax=Bartonella sp. DGB2 TaxID=3388426 RepID=UPI00398F9478
MENNKNILLALIAMAFLAMGGIFVRMSPMGPINTGLWRIALSLPILFPLLLIEKKYAQVNRLRRKAILLLFMAGVFLGFDLALWNIAFHHTTIANANIFSNFVPFIIIPFSYFFYKEAISRNFFIGSIIVLFGTALIIFGKSSPASFHLLGDTIALSVSFFYAAFLMSVYKLRHQASAIQIMYYSGYGSLVVLFIICLLTEGIETPTSWAMLAPSLGLAIFSQILGQGGLSFTLGRISASLASILVLTQPVLAALYAFFLFHETLSPVEIGGLFIVLYGIYLVKRK